MPHFDIVKTSIAERSYRVAAILDNFDLDGPEITEQFTGEIVFPQTWSVGAIVGRSGTGKTTIAKEVFGKKFMTAYRYRGKTVVDDMPKNATPGAIAEAFGSVGLSSPPSWIKPYSVLSTGERMRVDLARGLLGNADPLVFDEFTSVVDRTVARIGAYALQKAIRRSARKFVAISCHTDIIEWLLPDWTFSTDKMRMITSSKKKDHQCIFVLNDAGENFGACLLDTTI